MKEKNFFAEININNKIINFFTSPLLYILLFCGIVQKIIYGFTIKYSIFADTASYIQYSGNLLNGKVSAHRTPIYPYFIKFIRKLFGEENLYNNIVLNQYIIFFISIILFYLAIKRICKNGFLSCLSTIIYGISPYIFLWNNAILTESLSISSITLLAYMTVLYLSKPNKFFCYFVGIYIFGLIMLRPAFVYVAAIYMIFWIIRYFINRHEKINNIIGIVSMLICLMLVVIYCLFVKVQHGNFEITNVSSKNKIVSVLKSGTYESGNNENIINAINNEFKYGISEEKIWSCADMLIDKFKKEEIDKYCSSIYKNSTKTYTLYVLKNLFNLKSLNIGVRYVPYIFDYSSAKYKALNAYEQMILPINFIHIYIILFASIIYLIRLFLKYKKVPWIFAFLISMIIGNLFTTIVGSPGEYQRLFLASMPIVIMLLTYLIYVLFISVNNETLENKMMQFK